MGFFFISIQAAQFYEIVSAGFRPLWVLFYFYMLKGYKEQFGEMFPSPMGIFFISMNL